MLGTDGADSMFRSMIAVQISALIVFLLAGTVVTVFAQPHVLDVVPSGGYGPLVSWVVAGAVGYLSGGIIASIVGLIGFYKLG